MLNNVIVGLCEHAPDATVSPWQENVLSQGGENDSG
jgi:hypothetical protein